MSLFRPVEYRIAALAKLLRTVASPDNAPAARQVVATVRTLGRCEAAIQGRERRVDRLLYALYGLTEAERAMVERDRPRRLG